MKKFQNVKSKVDSQWKEDPWERHLTVRGKSNAWI